MLETSAATYSIDESGSIQAEGYSINSVVGNLTTADDLRVDGGKLDFQHSKGGTKVFLKDNQSASVIFGSKRTAAQSLLSIDTGIHREKVVVNGKLQVLGTLDLDDDGTGLQLKNMVLNADDPNALKYIVRDMSTQINITAFLPAQTNLQANSHNMTWA